jgi:hypothetical protein
VSTGSAVTSVTGSWTAGEVVVTALVVVGDGATVVVDCPVPVVGVGSAPEAQAARMMDHTARKATVLTGG